MPIWDRYSDAGGMSDLERRKWRWQEPSDDVTVYAKRPALAQEQLYCPACHEMRAWYPNEECLRCETEGPPPSDPTSTLTGTQVRILEALCEGHDTRAAARLAHVSIAEVETMLAGKDSGNFRRTWQLLLQENGITLTLLAEKAKESLEAADFKWHPALEDFIAVPDNKTRLNAVKWLAMQHELDPPREAPVSAQAGIVVNINTNLGDEATKQVSNADYAIEVTPMKTADDA